MQFNSTTSQTTLASKAATLRSLLVSKEVVFFMEAHNALSAKLAEEAGFRAIWASGLTISASLGLPDRNELSWSQATDVIEFMADSTTVPILMDGDTGFGNFNNVCALIRRICKRNIAGICLEDKVFPKMNSFVDGMHVLANVDEFCGRIRAAKDTQSDPNFCVVARCEALVAHRSISEALRRCERYRTAGADAILIHSKKRNPSEIISFAIEWNRRCPLVVVPTTYYDTPVDLLAEHGASAVIWANHGLRSVIPALRHTFSTIYRDRSVLNVESDIESINDLFQLTGELDIQRIESKYT